MAHTFDNRDFEVLHEDLDMLKTQLARIHRLLWILAVFQTGRDLARSEAADLLQSEPVLERGSP